MPSEQGSNGALCTHDVFASSCSLVSITHLATAGLLDLTFAVAEAATAATSSGGSGSGGGGEGRPEIPPLTNLRRLLINAAANHNAGTYNFLALFPCAPVSIMSGPCSTIAAP